MGTNSLWERFQQYFLRYDDLGFSIDISRMRFADDFFERMQPQVEKAFAAMRELEAGAIANPDEKRQVGHYWLRSPDLAPSKELRANIVETNHQGSTSKFADRSRPTTSTQPLDNLGEVAVNPNEFGMNVS